MVFGKIPGRYLRALLVALLLGFVQDGRALISTVPVAVAVAPMQFIIRIQPNADIKQLSMMYQLQVLDSIPALATYRVEAAALATLDLLAADSRVIAVQQDEPLSTFDAQHRNDSLNEVEALQRYFGFGNGEDEDESAVASDSSTAKQQKAKATPQKDGPPDQVLVIYDNQRYKKDWLDWGLRKIKLDKTRKYATGAGVTVAVLDTGAELAHPQLVGHLTAGYDFVDDDPWPNDEANGLDDDEDGRTDEGAGHGTHIANLIALIAPDAAIMPVRVLNSDGGGTLFDIVHGLVYAVDHGAQVINMSFSAVDDSPFLAAAVDYALRRQVLLVAAAAGADGYLEFPAAYDRVIAVGATEKGDHVTGFSAAFASEVDIFAPGELIYSAYYGRRTAWWSGTSMAAPFVAGGAALMVDRCECSPDLVASILLAEVKNIKPKALYRGGRLDLEKAVKKIPPALEPCDLGKPQALTFQFTGQACPASINRQEDKFVCEGVPSAGSAPIKITKDADKMYPSVATVNPGEFVTIRTVENRLKADLKLNIGGQLLTIHTSCSKPLDLGDQYGSLSLVGFVPEGAAVRTAGDQADEAHSTQQLFLPLVIR
jgi:hypothetical protein